MLAVLTRTLPHWVQKRIPGWRDCFIPWQTCFVPWLDFWVTYLLRSFVLLLCGSGQPVLVSPSWVLAWPSLSLGNWPLETQWWLGASSRGSKGRCWLTQGKGWGPGKGIWLRLLSLISHVYCPGSVCEVCTARTVTCVVHACYVFVVKSPTEF